MKIQLKRYGIVIKTITLSGDRAKVGSGADCDVMVEDPYLSAHVADLVRRGETWHLVDAGTSLEGVTRDGTRVEDEPMVPGQIYSIGGFELVAEGGTTQMSAVAPPGVSRESREAPIPGTMMDSPLPQGGIPGTIMESVAVPGGAEVPRTLYEAPTPSMPQRPFASPPPMPQAASPRPAAMTPAKTGSTRRILLLGAVFAMGILLLLLLIIVKGGKKKPEVEKAATDTKPAVTAPKPVTPVEVPKTPEEMLGNLNYDGALAAWEAQLARQDDPALRARYAEIALEVGRIEAAGNSPKARGYFERVVKFGAADSPQVAEAQRRLGS